MKRLAILLALTVTIGAVPLFAEADAKRQTYRVNTSAPFGMAVCSFVATVTDGARRNLAITVAPAAENPTTGENGGEIKLTGPRNVTAVAGVEEAENGACDAFFPDDDRVGVKRIRKNFERKRITFRLHSHPDTDCLAPGVARGAVTVAIPNPATVVVTEPTCDADGENGNVDAEIVTEPVGVRTDRPGRFVIDVMNHGPGMASDAFFLARFPDRIMILDATADGTPCRVATTPTIPPMRQVNCPLGDMFDGDSSVINIDFGATTAGPFDTTMNANSTNPGGLFGPTTFRGDVQQGTAATLYVTAVSSNGGTGSVNISPGGNTGTPHTSCATPDGTNTDVTCDNSYTSTTTVTLTAKPGAGMTIRWSGACSGVPATTTTCTVTLTPPETKTANVRFRKPNP